MILQKLIYTLGAKHRNPSLFKILRTLKESDKWDIEELEALQLQRLRNLLIFADQHSPFYTNLFKEYNFIPSQIQRVADLSRLPILDKRILVTNRDSIQSNAEFKTLRFSETSGTTGQALGIYRSEEWDSATRAAMLRGYGWYGVNPWEKNGYLWGYNFSKANKWKTQFLDSLQNRFRLFSYSDKEIDDFCKKLKDASFLSGYSSMIYEIAKSINRQGRAFAFPHLKMIKGTSEKIYPSYQEEVQRAFGLKMISEYGSMESGIIAYECPEGGHMHIAMEHVVLEEIEGQAVVTNLMSHSFPIIRYRLGDAIELAPNGFKCPCGRSHPVLLNVLGRVGKLVFGKKNNYPSLTFYYVFKNIALRKGFALNYQAVQSVRGKIQLNIEQAYSEDVEKAIREEMKNYFGEDLVYELSFSQQLHSHSGKLKDFIQNIN